MPKTKSKRKTTSHSDSRKAAARHSAGQTTVGKTAKLKPGRKSAAAQQQGFLKKQTGRAASKQARIIAMLRAPGGAAIDAMTRATGWQQHSVRGFLAGVVRKKLGLDLVSAVAERKRIYRITDRKASPVSAAKTSHAT